MFFYIVLGFFNCFFDSQPVQGEVTVRSDVRTRRVADDTFFGVETFFADITTFYQRADFQSEMLGKGVVAAVVSRYGHDSSRSVTGQYVVADPDRYCFACERVDRIRTTEYTGNAAVGNTFTFRTFLSTVEVSVYFRFLCRSG